MKVDDWVSRIKINLISESALLIMTSSTFEGLNHRCFEVIGVGLRLGMDLESG